MKTWEKILLYPIGLYLWLTDGIKKMSKKWKPAMAMLMAVVMICGMLPMTAMAANATTIKVAGTELTETGYYTVSSGTVGSKQDTEPAGGSGYVHWDAANHTLTLYGVTVDGGSTSSGIFANGDYTIKLAEGTNNTVQSSYTNAITCDSGSVTIEGPGAMTATGATNGIKAQYSVVIKANVTVTGNNGCGILNSPTLFSNNEDPVRIAATVTVSITGSTYGICVDGGYGASPVIDSPNVTINGGTAAFSVFPHGAPKLSENIGASAGESEGNLAAYDSASYSTYKCVKTRNLFTYTVSFAAGDGTGSMENATATEGKEYTLPACTFTAPSNKTFKAWSVGGEEKQPGDKITVSADTTVTAVWQEVVEYGVFVGDEQFTSANLVINDTDGGKATYDPTTNTVTLNNFKYSGNDGIREADDTNGTLNIVLEGENSITTQYICVQSGGDMTITKGSGEAASLTAVSTATLNRGIVVGGDLAGDLTVNDVTLDVTSGGYGFHCQNLIVDEDSVIVTKAWKAFRVHGNVVLTGSVVHAGDDADSAVRVDAPTYRTYENNKYVKIMPDFDVTLSFDANGGTDTMADATVAVGQEYTLPECGFTAPAGKQFKAWSVNGSEKQPGDKVVFMEDAAVTAIWEDIPHTCSIEPVEKVWPDCENSGKEAYYKCEGCGKFFEDANGTTEIANIETWGNLPKNGHTEGTAWEKDTTHHWHICTVAGCGAVIDSSKAAHSSTGANVATCQSKAVCDDCGATYGDFAGHDWNTDSWEKDATGHWHKCNTAGCTEKSDFAQHTPDHDGGATEEYAIKCSICLFEIEAQLGHTHVFDKEVAEDQYLAGKANCTDPAKYYKSCKCGEKGTETFTSGENLGHTEGTAWEKDATGHWHTCTVAGCGVMIDTSKAEHTPDREAATETDPIKCSVCGYEIAPVMTHTHMHSSEWKSDKDNHWNECACGDKANTAAHKDENADGKCDVCAYNVGLPTPPADPNNPQTGDNTQLGLWFALMLISVCGLVVVPFLATQKKGKYSH